MIEAGKLVSFHYTLSSAGEAVEDNRSGEPLQYVHGGGQILPKLEEALLGLAVGDEKTVDLSAADGYGDVNPEALIEVPTEQIPEGARQVGAMLQSPEHNGPIRVAEIKDDVIILDFNHPMAGKPLTFEITIVAVADAPA